MVLMRDHSGSGRRNHAMAGDGMQNIPRRQQNHRKNKPYEDHIKAHNGRILARIRVAVTAFDRWAKLWQAALEY